MHKFTKPDGLPVYVKLASILAVEQQDDDGTVVVRIYQDCRNWFTVVDVTAEEVVKLIDAAADAMTRGAA